MPATDYYKFKNAAQLRFGWALTVHKSMSYKWDEIFFNVETGGGKTNETYFKWIYTGLIRAKSKVSLINYSPISPFDNTEFRDQNTGQRPLEIFFRSENPEPELRLNELRDLVTTKLSNYSVRNVEHFNWQERYFINNSENQEAIISFSYNGQGNFRLPKVMGGNAELAEKVIETLGQKSEINSFGAINDLWRKSEYEKLKVALSPFDIKFELILQSNWKDKIRFFSSEDELEIEMDYDGDGRVSFITAKYYNTETIWTNLKSAIIHIKES